VQKYRTSGSSALLAPRAWSSHFSDQSNRPNHPRCPIQIQFGMVGDLTAVCCKFQVSWGVEIWLISFLRPTAYTTACTPVYWRDEKINSVIISKMCRRKMLTFNASKTTTRTVNSNSSSIQVSCCSELLDLLLLRLLQLFKILSCRDIITELYIALVKSVTFFRLWKFRMSGICRRHFLKFDHHRHDDLMWRMMWKRTLGPRTKIDVWKLRTWHSFIGIVAVEDGLFYRWTASPVYTTNIVISCSSSSSSSNCRISSSIAQKLTMETEQKL